ncbi:hypothetical protein LIER_25596 [Lithospermum erythrorhizon]|uniref:Uncharacterized protein n=1 Tax=Lithospermum erythrorhizon TaxID=34254 RepID=A0AAV3R8Q4_LITER
MDEGLIEGGFIENKAASCNPDSLEDNAEKVIQWTRKGWYDVDEFVNNEGGKEGTKKRCVLMASLYEKLKYFDRIRCGIFGLK